ncbi:MAG: Rpn family recombination-promoting nuclease/putative transposase [Chlamydiae bacterium]|nr:Rpn family recombination-promoting nuclease/putative transposase [Chlamydiota bacterium]
MTLDKHTFERDFKDFYFCFLELPKFNKNIDELQTIVEKWTFFFKQASQTREADLEKIIGSDEAIRAAYQALNQFSWSEEELNTYDRETKRERDAEAILSQQRIEGLAVGMEKGKAEGLAEGMLQGKKRSLLAVAKQMLEQGIEPEKVMQFTDLSEEETGSIHSESIRT